MTFETRIKIRGINPFVVISASQAAKLKPGWRKPLPVLVRINDKPANAHPTNMMPAGDGRFYLYLNGVARGDAEVAVGDRVQIQIAFDTEYRSGPTHPMPAWFRKGLRENLEAKKNWSTLPPSRKKEILRYVSRLQSEEARLRNLARALKVLSGQSGRFMARTWTNGR